MICDCGLVSKQRTLLDGIKSITGKLLVFGVIEQLYLRRCCFGLLVPSLYTLIHKEWIDDTSIVVVDPTTIQINSKDINKGDAIVYDVVRIKKSVLDRIIEFGDFDFKVVFVQSSRFIGPEYLRVANELKQAYHKVITMDNILNDLRYKYSAAVHDKTLLEANASTKIDELDSTENEATKTCERCSSLKTLRTSQKELKRITHEQINQTQYDLDISVKANNELEAENKKLREENLRLKEINKSLYMNR